VLIFTNTETNERKAIKRATQFIPEAANKNVYKEDVKVIIE